MNAVKTLRLLIACEALAIALTLAADSLTRGALPASLQAYLAEVEKAELPPGSTAVALLAIGAIVTLVVAWIGLWRLWRPARAIYTGAALAAVASVSFTGPVVSSGVTDTIGDVASITSGMILGLLYFSELRQHFGAPSA